MLESITCLAILVMSGLTAIEFYQWNIVRMRAQIALNAVSRAGAVGHADPILMHKAASGELHPLVGSQPIHGWKIETHSPTPAMFADFADPRLTSARGMPTIRNEFLAEQHEKARQRGWRDGIGPSSGKTIFDANTLRLRLSVLYRPRLPGIAAILRRLPVSGDDWKAAAYRQGLLVIVVESIAAMQSHPVIEAASNVARSALSVGAFARPSGSSAGVSATLRTELREPISSPVAGQESQHDDLKGTKSLPWPAATRDLCGTLLCCPETPRLVNADRPPK